MIHAPRQRGGVLAAFLGLLIVLAAAPTAAARTLPALTGRVVDEAHVLSPKTTARLTAKLAELERTTTDQLVIVTLPSLQGEPIEAFTLALGKAWGVGRKDIDNGVLFVIAPVERQVRIEVGYGLEGVLTDSRCTQILQDAVLPRFRTGTIERGVVDGADAIVSRLLAERARPAPRAIAAPALAR